MRPEAAVVVSRKGEARVLRGHPWIFRSDLTRERDVPPASLVRVMGPQGRLLGLGLYSSASEIRVRLVQRGSEDLPPGWLKARLEAALRWREEVAAGAGCYRLVHGEGDGLPGLVVDRYGDYLCVQLLSQPMDARREEIASALVELIQPRGILGRNDPRVRVLEGLTQEVVPLFGEVPERVTVEEEGRTLEVDLWKGQKTGLFLDQRENHLAARRYARGRALDAFSYDGGFALSIAPQCEEVLAVDLSDEAVARIAANAARNNLANVTAVNRNVFDLLRELSDSGQRFDTVVLDPPAFAKSRDAVEKAERGYKEINLRALKLLKPGGFLVTCSCSQHIHAEQFEAILAAAAADAGATCVVVERRGAGRDHPAVLGVPETSYLKCLVLRRLA